MDAMHSKQTEAKESTPLSRLVKIYGRNKEKPAKGTGRILMAGWHQPVRRSRPRDTLGRKKNYRGCDSKNHLVQATEDAKTARKGEIKGLKAEKVKASIQPSETQSADKNLRG